MAAATQCLIQRIGEFTLMMRFTGNVDQLCGHIDDIGREIDHGGHVDTVAA